MSANDGKCASCAHRTWSKDTTQLGKHLWVYRMLCDRTPRKIPCDYARGERGSCGPLARHWVERKEQEPGTPGSRAQQSTQEIHHAV